MLMHSPLQHLSVVLLSLTLSSIQPVTTAHPIRTQQWTKTGQVLDTQRRGVWEVFEKAAEAKMADSGSGIFKQKPNNGPNSLDTNVLTREPPPILNGKPDRPYKRRSSPSGKSLVSVLVPVAPTVLPDLYDHHHSHQQQEYKNQQGLASSLPAVGATAHTSSQHEGEIFGAGGKEEATQEEDRHSSSSSSSPPSSSAHTIPFFTYRITLPSLPRLKPAAFPLHPLPGIITTVMILLAMVWIAILTIGLVELGNYIWRKRREARIDASGVDDEEDICLPRVSGSSKHTKNAPGRGVGVKEGEREK